MKKAVALLAVMSGLNVSLRLKNLRGRERNKTRKSIMFPSRPKIKTHAKPGYITIFRTRRRFNYKRWLRRIKYQQRLKYGLPAGAN